MIQHPLIFVRHGATRWNTEGRYQGATDVELSPNGETQAKANAELIGNLVEQKTLDATALSIVSSPLKRAKDTAHIVNQTFEKPAIIRINRAFRELSLGRWEGLTSAEVKSRYYEERKNRKSDRWNFKPLNGEAMADRSVEIESALQSIPAHSIIVTHTVILRIIFHLLGGYSQEQAALEHPKHVGILVWDGALLHRQEGN